MQTFDFRIVVNTVVVNLLGGDTIWFIPCLILVETLYVSLRKCFKKLADTVCIVLAIATLFITSHFHIELDVWCWQTSLFALGFYAYGNISKEHLLNKRHAIVGICLYGVLCSVAGYFGCLDSIDMHNHKYGMPVAFLCLSSIGCIASVSLVQFMPSAKFLVEFGRYTLFMFPFHSMILRHVLKALYRLSNVPNMLLLLLAVAITSVILLFSVRYVYRYVPALGGKKKWIK